MAKRERSGLEKTVRVLFVLLLLSLMILAGYSQFVNQTFFPENAMVTVLVPVKSFFSSATDYVVDYLDRLRLRGSIETEYNKLRALNEQLMYQALFAEELQDRNDYLLELLGELNARSAQNPLHARVVGREPSNWFSEFTLNKGARDGVKVGMTVTTPAGMVGNVAEVFATSCKVITIIDSNFKIGGLIASSRDQGEVSGTLGIDGKPLCRMHYLPVAAIPRPGDTVVTSGVASGLAAEVALDDSMPIPKGLVLGKVRESTRAQEENKHYIVVEPAVDFQQIADVLILRHMPAAGGDPQDGTDMDPQITAAPLIQEHDGDAWPADDAWPEDEDAWPEQDGDISQLPG